MNPEHAFEHVKEKTLVLLQKKMDFIRQMDPHTFKTIHHFSDETFSDLIPAVHLTFSMNNPFDHYMELLKRVGFSLSKKGEVLVGELNGEHVAFYLDNGTLSEQEALQTFHTLYSHSRKIYCISNHENTLFQRTKVHLFHWIRSEFGSVEKANGKLTVSFVTADLLAKGVNPSERITF